MKDNMTALEALELIVNKALRPNTLMPMVVKIYEAEETIKQALQHKLSNEEVNIALENLMQHCTFEVSDEHAYKVDFNKDFETIRNALAINQPQSKEVEKALFSLDMITKFYAHTNPQLNKQFNEAYKDDIETIKQALAINQPTKSAIKERIELLNELQGEIDIVFTGLTDGPLKDSMFTSISNIIKRLKGEELENE